MVSAVVSICLVTVVWLTVAPLFGLTSSGNWVNVLQVRSDLVPVCKLVTYHLENMYGPGLRRVCSGHRREYEEDVDYYSGYADQYDPYYYNYYQGRSLQDSFQSRMGSLVKRYSSSHPAHGPCPAFLIKTHSPREQCR